MLTGIAARVPAQEPDQDPAASGNATQSVHYAPKNLQVLSKDISAHDIGALMKRYGEELGVNCSYCHVENSQTQKLDYASDENPTKQTARLMIRMLSDINTRYLAQLGDRRYAVPITCGNCHQGQSNPPPFEPK
jgi:hypothetical protein